MAAKSLSDEKVNNIFCFCFYVEAVIPSGRKLLLRFFYRYGFMNFES